MKFVLLTTFGNYIEASIAVSLLEEEGIVCHIEQENISTLMYMASGMRLMVVESQAERAAEVIKKVEEEFVKTIHCPRCSYMGFTIKMVTESHESVLNKLPFGRIMSFMSKTFTKEGTTHDVKHYVCNNCQKEFEDLPS